MDINNYKNWIINNYPAIWSRITADYRQNAGGGRAWLIGPANYLFQTEGIRWAVDPVYSSLFIDTKPNAAADIADLDMILLTHPHRDHFDTPLLQQFCRRKGLILAIPDFMVDDFLAEQPIINCDLRVITAGQEIDLGGLKAQSFNSLHHNHINSNEPELGWFVKVKEKTILLPGDIRNYDSCQLPCFETVDHYFAHVWLGYRSAHSFNGDDLDAFCQFVSSFSPSRVYLSHLLEISRDCDDLWSFSHAGRIMDHFLCRHPEIELLTTRTGQRLELW
jgi:hypothetical protein